MAKYNLFNNLDLKGVFMYEMEIFLKKKQKVFRIDPTEDEFTIDRMNQLGSLLKNISSLGFTLSPDIIRSLLYTEDRHMESFYNSILPVLKEMVGNDVEYKPMYPNFPKQVMEADEGELFINTLLHYITSMHPYFENIPTWFPSYEKEPIEPLDEKHELKIIRMGTIEEYNDIFINIVSSNSSITSYDKKIMEYFIKRHQLNFIVPKLQEIEIPFKEQLTYLFSLVFKYDYDSIHYLEDKVKTVTDVLRIAVALSNGDISLSKKCIFRNFKRSERRFLLSLIDKFDSPEEMNMYRTMWIRLGEKLNPGDYYKKYKNAAKNFKIIRDPNIKVVGFHGRVNKLLAKGEEKKSLDELKTRPGEFVRRFNEFAKKSNYDKKLVDDLKEIGEKVSTPVLIQFYNFFLNSLNPNKKYRIFFPKGTLTKAWVKNNDLYIPNDFCIRVLSEIEEILIKKFSKLEPIENVYIDEELYNYPVPMNIRNQLDGLKVIPRGTRFYIENNYIRFFMYWMNSDERIDLDLSTGFYDENWEMVNHISYTNSRDKKIDSCHSGDITDAPNGASEFIDINIKKLKDNGIKYFVPSIFSYTEQSFYQVPKALFGWMGRERINSGEIYEPLTVKNKFNLTSEGSISVPFVFDVEKREVTWLDLALENEGFLSGPNNIESVRLNLAKLCESYMENTLFSVAELLELHIEARGGKSLDKRPYGEDEIEFVEYSSENFDYNEINSRFL